MSAAETAHRAIRDRIIHGVYLPGSLISENAVATSIGMSRTPVRTALARLVEDGWVTVLPQRGALVTALTVDEIRDLADARVTLESSGVRRADDLARQALATELSANVDLQHDALSRGSVEEFVELTVAFHRGFVKAGGNAYLIDLCDRLADRQRQLLFAHSAVLLHRADQIVTEHLTLIEMMRTGNSQGFEAELIKHVTETHGPVLGPV